MKEKIACLFTCYNRVTKTLNCLEKLYQQHTDVDLHLFLVDDGSPDNTGGIVKEKYPEAMVLQGDGSLFWNRGMHYSFGEALKGSFDYFLWLNDDIELLSGAIQRLLDVSKAYNDNSIVVGSTRDPDTKAFTYGGYIQSNSLNRTKLDLIAPQNRPLRCDTFCGNCVLIPKIVARAVGNIDPAYMHRWGDVDYGLRAKKKGVGSWIAPGYVAECEANPRADLWKNTDLSLRDSLRELHGIKGLGKNDWWYFVRMHGGFFWLWTGIKPYLRILYNSMSHKIRWGI